MSKKIIKLFSTFLFSFILLAIGLFPFSSVKAVNNSLVITNENFRDYTSMSVNDVNNFLKDHNSWLADYVIPEYISVEYPALGGELFTDARQNNDVAPSGHNQLYGKTAAQLIIEECTEHHINPKVILTALQKESTSIDRTMQQMNDLYTNSRSWPMFYNYDDTMLSCFSSHSDNCNDSKYNQSTYEWRAQNYGGVGQQIAYATAWYNMSYTCFENPSTCSSTSSTTRAWYVAHPWNETITISGQSFNSSTIATRVLYVYTPGLQDSFYNVYLGWFGDPAVNSSASPPPAPAPSRKAGDSNGDSAVDLLDLSLLASNWGTSSSDCDFNQDGVVDLLDLSILASNWGQ